jgi:hypothetical protein
MVDIRRSLGSIDLPHLEAPKVELPSIDLPDVDAAKALEPITKAIARLSDDIRGRRSPAPDPGAIIGGIALGVVAGAIVMYFLDPDAGRRRRALVRDQLIKLGRVGSRQLEATGEQIADRSAGVMAEARSAADGATGSLDGAVDDATLEERVRSELGRIGDTGSIQISARNGQILVEGWLPEDEADRILDAIRAVPGVGGVIDRRSVPQT